MLARMFPIRRLVTAIALLGIACSARANEAVYDKVIRSTAWIVVPKEAGGLKKAGPSEVGIGTGVVIDAEDRLLLTACHVVADGASPVIFFPKFDRRGLPIAKAEPYSSRLAQDGIEATVVHKDPVRDLALVKLSRLPSDAAAVPLATRTARPGQRIYVIGNSGADCDALWRMTTGTVRQFLADCVRYGASEGSKDLTKVVRMRCDMLETQLPVNGGDSGGPALNDAGEVVGVCSTSDGSSQNVSYMIDAGEVREMMAAYRQKNPKRIAAPIASAPAAKPWTPYDAIAREPAPGPSDSGLIRRPETLSEMIVRMEREGTLKPAPQVYPAPATLVNPEPAATLPRLTTPRPGLGTSPAFAAPRLSEPRISAPIAPVAPVVPQITATGSVTNVSIEQIGGSDAGGSTVRISVDFKVHNARGRQIETVVRFYDASKRELSHRTGLLQGIPLSRTGQVTPNYDGSNFAGQKFNIAASELRNAGVVAMGWCSVELRDRETGRIITTEPTWHVIVMPRGQ